MEDPKPNTSRKILPIAEALWLLCPQMNWGVEGDNYEDIKWYGDPKDKPSKEVVEAKAQELLDDAPWKVLRRQRDARLREVDWVTLRSVRTGEPIPQEWKDYMQALADITKTSSPRLESGELLGVTWPTRPDGEPVGQDRLRVIR